jgi:hypothetical protein
VVIAAQSAPGNVRERGEVRSTWGENCNAQNWCRLIFVVGNVTNKTMQDQILSKTTLFSKMLTKIFLEKLKSFNKNGSITFLAFLN